MTTYTLSGKAQELAKLGAEAGLTLQAPSKGLGQAWRAPGHKAPNTRAVVLNALQAHYPSGFTFAQAVACLAAGAKAGAVHLGSGTPNSYCKAFVANGYFEEVLHDAHVGALVADTLSKLEDAPVAKRKRAAK
jgi:hypothetical protein